MSDAPKLILEPVAYPEDDAAAHALGGQLIRYFEGFRSHPYLDTGGTWTIGYGTVLIDGEPVTASTSPITEPEAESLMQGELLEKEREVEGGIAVYCTPQQRAALYSFAYEEGVNAFLTSTLRRKLNAGDYSGAAAEFEEWVYVDGRVDKGVMRRRILERQVFEGGPLPT